MCDTFVVLRPGSVILAKNSDRDPNEPQRLEWIPARDHAPQSTVQCTWTRIPQVARTHALVISRPYWMWGAEMGANEHGVAIGNEAVFARGELPADALTGMDLLRLGLERATTAVAATDLIRELLARHGQGGDAGYASTGFRYHNSFLIADRGEAWLLESVGRETEATRIVSGVHAVSNELQSPRLRRHAKRLHGLAARASRRQTRTACLAATVHGIADALHVLADHGEGNAGPRFNRLTGALGAPCAHAGGVLAAAQTTGSWASLLSDTGDQHWATGTTSPCLSLFRPLEIHRPRLTGTPGGQRDTGSLWWRHERLHRATRLCGWTPPPSFAADRARVQAAMLASPAEAWTMAEDFLERWENAGGSALATSGPRWLRRYWEKVDLAAGAPALRPWRDPD